jgi:hypothetical protein
MLWQGSLLCMSGEACGATFNRCAARSIEQPPTASVTLCVGACRLLALMICSKLFSKLALNTPLLLLLLLLQVPLPHQPEPCTVWQPGRLAPRCVAGEPAGRAQHSRASAAHAQRSTPSRAACHAAVSMPCTLS